MARSSRIKLVEWVRSSVVEHRPFKSGVVGSKPTEPIRKGMNLSGKTTLVTGGAPMGSTIGQALGSKGCSVIFPYRNSRKSADDAVNDLKKLGYQASSMACDVS